MSDTLSGFCSLPYLELAGTLTYDSRTFKTVGNAASVRFQQAKPTSRPQSVRFQRALHVAPPTTVRWQPAVPLVKPTQVRFQDNATLSKRQQVRFQDATPTTPDSYRVRFQDSLNIVLRVGARYQDATPSQAVRSTIRYQPTLPRGRQYGARYQDAIPLQARFGQRFSEANPLAGRRTASRYQDAIQPGIGIYVSPGVDDICYVAPPGDDVRLVFHAPSTQDTALRFFCELHYVPPEPPRQTITIPVQRVYVVINEASLTRVDGNVPILNTAFSLSIDVDSWTFSFSARVPARQLGDLQPGSPGDRVVLQAMINGAAYRVVVEQVQRDRTFGGAWLTVSGRGINAALDAPYAPSMNFTVPGGGSTAQQLLDHVLQDNGVSLGWDIDWQMAEDWAVPEGAWSHQGTYMSAVREIAAAAGGYVQPHPVNPTMRILPRYPSLPWTWATETPDFVIPADIAQREGTEWVQKPAYNRVYLSGQGVGVSGRVTRTGTDGALLAPQVVDPLITAGEALRMRGESILGDTGRQALITLRMPVPTASGLILPGKFARYHENGVSQFGIVRSMRAEVATSGIWQTILLETHV